MLDFYFGASNLVSYYESQGCERTGVMCNLEVSDKRRLGWFSDNLGYHSSQTAGKQNEEEIFIKIKERDIFLHDFRKDRGKPEKAIEFLVEEDLSRKQINEMFLYQMPLSVTEKFVTDNISGLNEKLVIENEGNTKKYFFSIDSSARIKFSLAYPDFIWAVWDSNQKKWCLRVVDAKRSSNKSVAHKMQIGYYILLLKSIVDEENLAEKYYVDEECGYVWTKASDEPEAIYMRRVLTIIRENFFQKNFPNMILKMCGAKSEQDIMDVLAYFPLQRCEFCHNFSYCRSYASQKEPMLLAPYMTRSAQQFLRDLNSRVQENILIPEGFQKFVAKNSDELKKNPYWRKYLGEQEAYLSLFEEDEKKYIEKKFPNLTLKFNEDITVILTAQREEINDRVYCLGIFVGVESNGYLGEKIAKVINQDMDRIGAGIFCKSNYGNLQSKNVDLVMVAKDPLYYDDLERAFTYILHRIMGIVDKWNKESEFTDQKTVSMQAYVMDNYEIQNIRTVLNRQIFEAKDFDISEKARDVLFWLQDESLVNSEIESRPEEAMESVNVMSSAISQLYAFRLPISYNLIGIAKCFEINYNLNKKFLNRLSNTMNNLEIFEFWETKDLNHIDNVSAHLRSRLTLECEILTRIRDLKSGHPLVKKLDTPFHIQKMNPYREDFLNRLWYEAQMEFLLRCSEVAKARNLPIDDAIETRKSVKLRLLNTSVVFKNKYEATFEIVSGDEGFVTNIFQGLLLRVDNSEGLKYLRSVSPRDDCSRNIEWEENEILRLSQFATEGGKVTANFSHSDNRKWFSEGKEYILYELAYSGNLEKIKAAFSYADEIITENPNSMLANLVDVSRYYGKTSDNYAEDEARILKYGGIGNYNFSASQREAMKQLYNYNICLVQGPPGTGKTDFLARGTHVIGKMFFERKKRLRVLVTGPSHTAINNVLEKIRKNIYLSDGALSVFNLRYSKHDEISKRMEQNENVVVGGTCWGIHNYIQENKGSNSNLEFDLIIFDEASQYRMIDAIIPLSCAHSGSRILIAGDEEQLPAIIQGSYGANKVDKPYLYGSVSKFFSDCARLKMDMDGNPLKEPLDYSIMLNENFRSNWLIIEHSSNKLYGSKYRCANDQIKYQVLRYSKSIQVFLQDKRLPDNVKEALEIILEPEHPLVLCWVDDNEKNAKLIKLITCVLENTLSLRQDDGAGCVEVSDAESFWGTEVREGLFGIISPHHAHISEIKRALTGTSDDTVVMPWKEKKENIFIGTVDKLQGKERECMLISYGDITSEKILSEKAFIWNSNRLNVSITRAKKKAIVILPEILHSYPVDALGNNDAELEKGIEYMIGFVSKQKERGKYYEFDFWGTKLHIYVRMNDFEV